MSSSLRPLHAIMLILIFGIAGCSAPRGPSETVAQFENGPAAEALGVQAAGPDTQGLGPTAITVGADARIYVLDALKNRVVSVAADGRSRRDIPLTGVRAPADLAAVQNHIFVFDRASSSVRDLTTVSGASGQEAGAGNVAAAVFRQTGLGVTATAGEGALEAGPTGDGYAYAGRSDQAALAMSADGSVVNYRLKRSDAHSGTLNLSIEGKGDIALPLKTNGDLVSATIIGRDAQARIYVLIEDDIGSDGESRIQRSLGRFTAAGQRDADYVLPTTSADLDVTRTLAVAPDGVVYALVVGDTRTTIQKLNPQKPTPPSAAPVGARAVRADIPSATPDENGLEVATKAATITRAEARATAERYASFAWTVSRTAYAPGRLSQCTPAEKKYWRRPKTLEGMIGRQIQGLPYCWGCADTIEQFAAAIEPRGGKVAGNTCTCRNAPCALADTAGVDCSGFVSNVLRTGRHGTSSLPTVTQTVPSQAQLRPMDIYNKAGSHVVLFDGFVEGPTGRQVRVFESSVGCAGVCHRVVPLSYVNGYAMRRRLGISD